MSCSASLKSCSARCRSARAAATSSPIRGTSGSLGLRRARPQPWWCRPPTSRRASARVVRSSSANAMVTGQMRSGAVAMATPPLVWVLSLDGPPRPTGWQGAKVPTLAGARRGRPRGGRYRELVSGSNRLGAETSPYLRQHADNPVDWYPWGEEAFAAARERDVPILVSIGYSACHWCHVMAHESFEDPAVAAVMNRVFVNVKVDREERPDVDDVYMEATQAMTGSGGWPMTVVCLPDGRPFFAGTYFPKEPRGGMMGFVQLCERIEALWHTRRDELEQQAEHLTGALGRAALIEPSSDLPSPADLDDAVASILATSDPVRGGLGGAPKFPQPMAQEVLAAAAARGHDEAEAALVRTLDHMASGGIYDHLGGGFARYAVDSRWLVPHFEKMLYDNALLIRLYLHGWLVTGEDRYRQVVSETVGYVLRDLRLPDGGVASAEDADSEGEEGRFYLWTPAEVRAVLGDAAPAALDWYGVTEQGNVEGGRTILNRLHAVGELARPADVEAARQALLEARAQRVRPGLDDKVLTEWNAYLVAALAEAGAAIGETTWVTTAVE